MFLAVQLSHFLLPCFHAVAVCNCSYCCFLLLSVAVAAASAVLAASNTVLTTTAATTTAATRAAGTTCSNLQPLGKKERLSLVF